MALLLLLAAAQDARLAPRQSLNAQALKRTPAQRKTSAKMEQRSSAKDSAERASLSMLKARLQAPTVHLVHQTHLTKASAHLALSMATFHTDSVETNTAVCTSAMLPIPANQ